MAKSLVDKEWAEWFKRHEQPPPPPISIDELLEGSNHYVGFRVRVQSGRKEIECGFLKRQLSRGLYDLRGNQQKGVYLLSCVPTGEVYVGSSLDLSKTVAEHKKALKGNRHHCPRLQTLFWEYGPELLDVCLIFPRFYAQGVRIKEHLRERLAREGLLLNEISN
jgi:hypothetical protein